MKRFVALFGLAGVPALLPLAATPQEARDEAAEPAAQPAEPPPPPPYEGSLRGGLLEIRALLEDGDGLSAYTLAGRMLRPTAYADWSLTAREAGGFLGGVARVADVVAEPLGFFGLDEEERAMVHFARGVVQREISDLAVAGRGDFFQARALAGPGDLRADAIYNVAWGDLAAAEQYREQIPEIAEKLGRQPQPPPPRPQAPGGPGGTASMQGEQPEDPLVLARGAYHNALDRFAERLRVDWGDADTRANVELIQRRLRELDELEQQREEQQQEQEQQDEQQQDEQESEEQEGDEGDESEEESEEEQQQPESDDQESEDPPPDQAPAEPQELHLTKEEVMQLLKQLEEIEEEGEQTEAQLRRQRRQRVKRDW